VNKYPCQYAIIRFAPFAETEEFANVGLVLFVPALGELHYHLTPGRFKRVTQFFGHLEPGMFANALNMLKEELERLAGELPAFAGKEMSKQIFTDFTRRPSGLVHFSHMRVIRAEDPAVTAKKLFDHYVGRNFNTREYRETVLQRKLKATFKRFKLERYYREDKIQAGIAEFKMPFVHRDERNKDIRGAIKPLAFDQQTLNSQVEHADLWLARARHMLDSDFQPETLLFTIDWDSVGNPKMTDYLNQFESQLRKSGIKTLAAEDESAVVDFAKAHA